MTGKLAIVAGVDGAGKSTIVRRLAALGFATSHWRMLRQIDERWVARTDYAAKSIRSLRGAERVALIREIVDGEWHECIAPRRARNEDVICDGFYLRFLAKEAIYHDCDLRAVWDLSPLSGTELVVMIDTPIGVVVERKGDAPVSPYECFTGPNDFAVFQERQRAEWLALLNDWDHVVVNGDRSGDAVLADVVGILAKRGFRATKGMA